MKWPLANSCWYSYSPLISLVPKFVKVVGHNSKWKMRLYHLDSVYSLKTERKNTRESGVLMAMEALHLNVTHIINKIRKVKHLIKWSLYFGTNRRKRLCKKEELKLRKKIQATAHVTGVQYEEKGDEERKINGAESYTLKGVLHSYQACNFSCYIYMS